MRPRSKNGLRLDLLAIEPREEVGVAFGQFTVDLQAGVGPAADPFAVVKIGSRGRAVADVRFVIAPAGTERPRPARLAVRLVVDVMLLEKRVLRRTVDA